MLRRPAPVLGAAGWVTDSVSAKADYILSWFFESLPSENWMVETERVSIQSLTERYTQDIQGLMAAIREVLSDKFRLYFEEVAIDVSITNEAAARLDGRYDIKIAISIVDDEEPFTMVRHFQGHHDIFKMVVKEVNYGQ